MSADQTFQFLQVDVFTDRRLAGNPLAVVLDARGLTLGSMQAIAREMNLSETSFILPAEAGGTARVRIFTPNREMPFAGHPTLGTAFVLHERGAGDAIVLETNVGQVPVRVEHHDEGHRLWLRHPDFALGDVLGDAPAFARALGLAPHSLLADAPVQIVGTAVPHLFVALADRTAVDAATLDVAALRTAFGDARPHDVFVFAPDGEGRVYSRMFAPLSGVPEDPATGGASGQLASYLVAHGLAARAQGVRVISEQGTLMGRQSFVHLLIDSDAQATRNVEVGGGVVTVIEGALTLDAELATASR